MSRITENTAFLCENCGKSVEPLNNGSFRNHCPYCLCSKHLDILPGDRKSECKGLMDPIDIEYTSKKGYVIVHKCRKCGEIKKNKTAENTIQPDDLINFFNQRNI